MSFEEQINKMCEGSWLNKPVPRIPLNITIAKEDSIFIARCDVLDIVASNTNFEEVKKDIVNLIKAYVKFAVTHNNWSVLFDFDVNSNNLEEIYK